MILPIYQERVLNIYRFILFAHNNIMLLDYLSAIARLGAGIPAKLTYNVLYA